MAGDRGGRISADVALGVALALVAAAVAASAVSGLSWAELVDGFVVSSTVLGLALALPGFPIARQRPGNPVGWLLLAAGLGFLVSAAGFAVLAWGTRPGESGPGWRLLADLTSVGWLLAVTLALPLTVLLFPDGRLPGRRWWWVLLVAGTGAAAGLVVFTLGPQDTTSAVGVQGYLRWPALDELAGPLSTVAGVAVLLTYAAGVAGLAVRYRRGDEVTRRRLLWVLLAGLVMVAAFTVDSVLGLESLLGVAPIALLPVAILIAMLRYQLLDIQLVVSRTVLYLLLTGLAVATYVTVVALGEATFSARLRLGPPVLATVLIALAFNPLRVWLQQRVDRLFYGAARDPARALAVVGVQLGRLDPTGPEGLDEVLAVMCRTLNYPAAAITIDGAVVASAGQPGTVDERVPLRLGDAPVGELTIGLRRGEKRLDPKDAAVLGPLAASLAVSVQATRYAADLQHARQSLVAAREAERSRLHRDLHDGLGPVLTSVQLKADAARRIADTDPAQATALMDQIRAQTTDAIAEVRRIVRDLRPPSLDTVGLIPAIRQHADTLHPLRVRLDCPDPMPPLPAAIDVALYRIATEALTNIVRHAPTATTATVELAHSADRLTLTVADNAVNGTQPWAPGVGLTSMTARAAELGGRLTAAPTPAGGRVEASLPCGRSPR